MFSLDGDATLSHLWWTQEHCNSDGVLDVEGSLTEDLRSENRVATAMAGGRSVVRCPVQLESICGV